MLVVVDTSLWIDYQRGRLLPDERARLEQAWEDGRAVLYQLVWLELVIGYRSAGERRLLQDYRALCRWEPLLTEDASRAETIAATLRKAGRAIGASDLLVLAAADRLGARVAHHDADFSSATEQPALAHLAWK